MQKFPTCFRGPEVYLVLVVPQPPRYHVILKNDDKHCPCYVISALTKSILGMTEAEAIVIVLSAHRQGSALVITCVREQAEHYQQNLCDFGLVVVIEEAAL